VTVAASQADIVRIGREIFSRCRAAQPWPLSRAWLDERAMRWSMRDERVKTQLFRFVDALPGLHTRESLNRHLHEYLGEVAHRLPAPARAAIASVGRGGLAGLVAPFMARFGARRLARTFIAGSRLDDTLATLARLRARGLAFTIDLLGEAILSEDEADAYQRAYLDLTAGLCDAAAAWREIPAIDRDDRGPLPKVNISIKISALSSRVDPCDPDGSSRRVRERLRPVLRAAKARGAFVNVDMESHALKDLTLKILRDALDEEEFRGWGDVGVAIQAYLRSCGDDLRALAGWAERRGAPLWVRLVKGAYWDYETVIAAQNGWDAPVFTAKAATDANYERQALFLLEHRDVLRPAFASHNVRSIASILAAAEKLRVPRGAIEFQMLFGMADALKQAVAGRGERVRVYTPYGELLPGMAYLVRRLLENTSNQGFVRVGFIEHGDEERLLMDPASAPAAPAPVAGAGFRNSAPADFSRAQERDAMLAALAGLRLGRRWPLVIGGRPVDGAETIVSTDPADGSLIGTVVAATAQQADAAVAAAHAAFPAWRDTSAEERSRLLERVADVLHRRRWELSALIVRESGKNWREAEADVGEAIDFHRFYASEMRRLAQPRRRDVPGELNEQIYEPRGVCVVIAPWNFPLAILSGMAAAAVVAGNTAIMKPAEQTPVIAAELMAAWQEAGAPAGVMNFLPGVGEVVGPVLVRHPRVSVIAFTGSREVGLAIHRGAAEVAEGADEVKRTITEMGGKNAIIIDESADLDEAVAGVMASAFGFQGQKCSACSRAIVHAARHDAFLERLIAATRSLTIGAPIDPVNWIGPVIDREARDRIRARIAEGGREARLVYAGEVPAALDAQGAWVAPHIFGEVPSHARLAQEEIFGPVLAVMRARDLDDALAIANGTRYALTGGLYSRSPAAIARARRELRVGNLYINRKITGALVDRQPFGGFKLSGIGSKAGGPDYLLQFVVPRVITESTLRHGFAPDAPAGE